jgi:VNT family MFS transporter (synaptic vesicle glycoprotein 2)
MFRLCFAGIGVVIENKEHFSAWHQFLLVCSLPSLAAIIGFVFLPESPRYLLEAGREVEAMMVYQVTVSSAVN